MTVTWESARSWVSIKAPWLIPVISSTTATGSTNYLVDTGLWLNPADNYLTPKQAAGMHIFFPDSSTASERNRRVSGATPVDTDNGRLYFDGTAWSGNVASASQYELAARPFRAIYNVFVQTLREFLLPDLSPLSVFTDSDMEVSGVTNYSISGAGSIAKNTTAGNVFSGGASMFFDAGTAGEYVEAPTVTVTPGQQYFGSTILRVAAGTFSFAVWDKTNNAEIGSRVSSSLRGFVSLQRQFQVPTTCKQVAFRVYCTAATDDAYIDCFHGPYKSDDLVIDAPSHLYRPSLLRKVADASYSQYEDGVYDARTRFLTQWYPRDYALRVNSAHANAYRFEMRRHMPMAEVWIENIRKGTNVYTPAFTAAGETSPSINVDEDLFGLSFLSNLCKEILSFAPDDTQARGTLRQILTPRREGGDGLNELLQDYQRSLETPLQEPAYPISSMRAL